MNGSTNAKRRSSTASPPNPVPASPAPAVAGPRPRPLIASSPTPRVTAEQVLHPHHDATLARIAEHPVVLLPQDTTELDFSQPQQSVEGAGPLSYEERTGFFQHVQLAVAPQRLPLGLIDVTTWGRDREDYQKNDRRKQKPIEEKESYRWLLGYRRACAVATAVPGTQIISISDREGDIYECFAEARTTQGVRADWIIRACQDRSTPRKSEEDETDVKLRQTVAAQTPLGRLKIQVPRSADGPAREATLTVRSATLELKPPDRVGRKLPPVTVNAVGIGEESPSAGVKPLDWLLLTSLPVATFEAACLVVEYYSCRWPIESILRLVKRAEHATDHIGEVIVAEFRPLAKEEDGAAGSAEAADAGRVGDVEGKELDVMTGHRMHAESFPDRDGVEVGILLAHRLERGLTHIGRIRTRLVGGHQHEGQATRFLDSNGCLQTLIGDFHFPVRGIFEANTMILVDSG
jgi:hypothetical protein